MCNRNEHYSFDFNYSYSDVYISTNACYLSGASVLFPGSAQTNSAGTGPNLCPNLLTDWGPVKDFMDAPTQYASFGLTYSPTKVFRSGLGYRISAVSGNQFFSDAQQVNGSLQSAYQSPYVNLAWTVHPGLIWRADYNFYGYGELYFIHVPLHPVSTNCDVAHIQTSRPPRTNKGAIWRLSADADGCSSIAARITGAGRPEFERD